MSWEYLAPHETEPIPDEYVWDRLRLKRDKLLANSDWTQVADAPVDKAAWSAYRQSLRDLPESVTDPREAVWPEPPTV